MPSKNWRRQISAVPAVLVTMLVASPCASFGSIVEQNLQYSMRDATGNRPGNDCERLTASAVEWGKEGLSINATKLALSLVADTAASHFTPRQIGVRANPCRLESGPTAN